MKKKVKMLLGRSTELAQEMCIIDTVYSTNDPSISYGQSGKFLSDCGTAFGERLSLNRICRKIDSFVLALRKGDLNYCRDIVSEFEVYHMTDNWIERYIYLTLLESFKSNQCYAYLDDLDTINNFRNCTGRAKMTMSNVYQEGSFMIADGSNGIKGLINFALDMTRR